MHPYEVIRRPIVTEKSTLLGTAHKYTFEVARKANKAQVREAVEKAFSVSVLEVNMIHVPGKMRRVGRHRGVTSSWKKAVVTINPDQRIELYEGA